MREGEMGKCQVSILITPEVTPEALFFLNIKDKDENFEYILETR